MKAYREITKKNDRSRGECEYSSLLLQVLGCDRTVEVSYNERERFSVQKGEMQRANSTLGLNNWMLSGIRYLGNIRKTSGMWTINYRKWRTKLIAGGASIGVIVACGARTALAPMYIPVLDYYTIDSTIYDYTTLHHIVSYPDHAYIAPMGYMYMCGSMVRVDYNT